ncbi:MAG TPA: NAD(P)-binding domain-containing protein, partial [Propionibacteriaceae bacterium]
MRISVVALGKIGLPLAVHFAERGHDVVGSDVDQSVVALVNRGEAPFPGEAHLDDKLAAVVKSGRLTATTDTTAAVGQADVVVVVVPLFVDEDGEPQFGWLDSATADIAKGLRSGTLVLYETTLPVGTTRNRWRPLLEQGS